MNLTYDDTNLVRLQEHLGFRRKEGREGTYSVDPHWLRRASNRKVYFWDYYTGKWLLVSLGDSFYLDENEIPRKTGLSYGRPQN